MLRIYIYISFSKIFRHFRRAVGALVVFDLTKRTTYENVLKWIKSIKKHAEPDIVIMVVGNKLDLCQKNATSREIPTDEAEKFAAANNFLYQETSAIDSTNVKESFEQLLESIYIYIYIYIEIYKEGVAAPDSQGVTLNNERKAAKTKGCVCFY